MKYKDLSLIVRCLAVLILSFTLHGQGTWTPMAIPVNKSLISISFADDQNGWIVGEAGTILHTTDGGDSWEIQRSNEGFNLMDVHFIDPLRGWALSWKTDAAPYGTNILSTTDGGSNWISRFYPEENVTLRRIFFRDAQNGWVCGEQGTIAYTSDGGDTWRRSQLDTTLFTFFPVRDVQFFSDKYGFAGGGSFDRAGMIWRTSDYGLNWEVYSIGPEPIQAILILDSLNVIAAGGDFEYGTSIARTVNGGKTWTYNTLDGINAFGIARDIERRTADEIWIPLGAGEKFIFSDDAGQSWQSFATPDSANIFDMTFLDSLTGFAVSLGGKIYKFNSLVSIDPAAAPNTSDFALAQNYPNPFNPATRISFSLPRAGKVTLTVYDVNGRAIRTLVNGPRSPGRQTIYFQAADLAAGVYFYRVRFTSFDGKTALSKTKKMLLVK